jgi:hypothetical protein
MGIFIPTTKTSSWVYCNRVLIFFQLFSFKRKGVKRFAQSIWFKNLSPIILISSMGAKMLKFPIPERQEINLEFKNKSFCWVQNLVF